MKSRSVLPPLKTTLLTLLTVAGAHRAAAVERVLALSPESTEITFSLKATGEDVLGSFQLTRGEIHFDTETGEAFGQIDIDARRSETGNKKRDNKMHHKVLDSEHYPLIQFTPESIEGSVPDDGVGEAILHGTVRLLGLDHPLDLPARVEAHGSKLSLATDFQVPYVDWGLHNPSILILKVAKIVDVSIVAEGELVGGDLDVPTANGQ